MKKYLKEMLQTRLDNEEEVIADLKRVYEQASKDCADKIAALSAREELQNTQSIIYQKQYQQALKKQIDAILDILQTEEFATIAEYLSKSYEDGFISAIYSLQEQGIPLVFPIDQSAVVKAIQTDSKISTNLYTRLGEDIKTLKTSIRSEVSRGIAAGLSYNEVAAKIAKGMNTPFRKAYNNAIRISRTEGNRVANQSAMDACYKAREKGANVAKRWCAYLDSRTRESHAMIDGEIRELDEKFSNGLMFPLDPNGKASEVINCRCALEQKAKAFLDYEETQWLGNVSKMTDEQKERLSKKLKVPVDELEKYSDSTVPIRAKNYEDFKRQYKNIWNYEGSDLQKEVDARLARRKAEKEAAKALTKSLNRVKISTQFFAESDIKNQESGSLKRAMRKYQNKIAQHQDKINNPQKYIADWDKKDIREQNGLKKHWQKEINNFQTSIDDRIAELKERGDYDE